MSKRILMIAYHYPPIIHSSGVHRTAKFVQYLPQHSWYPDVLTVHPRAYLEVNPEILPPPENTTIKRAFALDTARHLSIKDKYFKFLSLPDRWVSWWFGAIPSGLNIIRKRRPDVIWSTYPIATAHLIGYTLHRITGIPWVADFRDPMTDKAYPPDPTIRKIFHWIEKKSITHCTLAVFTTPDTLEMYKQRFPNITHSKYHVIANGYDEDAFQKVEYSLNDSYPKKNKQQLYFIHSGALYPSERNPEPFFRTIAQLKQSAKLSNKILKISLRASGNEKTYRQRLRELDIDDIVSLEPSLIYEKALAEMIRADGLLLFQAANCNHQVPAKVYEYLRAKRPIFALTDHKGNTAELLRNAGINTIVDIESLKEISKGLLTFIETIQNNQAPLAPDNIIQSFSRKQRTIELVKVLNSIY